MPRARPIVISCYVLILLYRFTQYVIPWLDSARCDSAEVITCISYANHSLMSTWDHQAHLMEAILKDRIPMTPRDISHLSPRGLANEEHEIKIKPSLISMIVCAILEAFNACLEDTGKQLK